MRPLTAEETRIFFEKLSKYVGDNIKQLLERSDGLYCFRLHKERVYYISDKLVNFMSSIPGDNIISAGICFGKFTKTKKFHLHITALDAMAPFAPYKVVAKENAETSFMYGNHILKSGLSNITENTPKNKGVIVCSHKNIPLGLGVAAKSAVDCRNSDPIHVVTYHQADVGEYIRSEDTLTWFMQKALKHIAKSNLSSITSVSSKYLIGNCSRITSEYQKMRDIKPKSTHNVCIEGNIGCGKTTFLNYFSQFNDVDVLHEPVNKWMNLNDYNLLDLMYKDPNRWCHLFQTYVQLTMMEQHLKPSTASTKIMERSLFSARHCFVENLYRTKKMSEVEYKVYCEWFRLILKIIDCRVDLIVYLRTDPKILNERIISRARTEEAQIPLEYLESLHRLHEEWLIEGPLKTSIPVLVIDANASLTEMKEIYKKHIQEIVRGSSTPERSPLKAIQPSSLSPAGEKHERGSQAQERLTLSSSCSHSQQ